MGRSLPRICVECHEPAQPGTNRCANHPAKRSPSSHATSTAEWKRVRRLALTRDGHTCVLCGALATQVDHKIAVADGGDNSLSNARSVCASCNLEARPGYTPRKPTNVAAKLAELRELLAGTVSVDARLSLKRQIARLEERQRQLSPATGSPDAGQATCSGVLSRLEAAPPHGPATPPDVGWRAVGAISAADVIGMTRRT